MTKINCTLNSLSLSYFFNDSSDIIIDFIELFSILAVDKIVNIV